MGDTYQDLYAAIGVHSGLACGAASDMPSAFAAMRQGAGGVIDGSSNKLRIMPTIVFHGDRDGTVHQRNGDFVVAQSVGDAELDTPRSRDRFQAAMRIIRRCTLMELAAH
jgi:poly(3-hydroxybutyrate) depolymerase